jgi:hypothetical protein
VPGAFQRLAQHRAQFCFVLDQEKGFHQTLFYHVFPARSARRLSHVRCPLSGAGGGTTMKIKLEKVKTMFLPTT